MYKKRNPKSQKGRIRLESIQHTYRKGMEKFTKGRQIDLIVDKKLIIATINRQYRQQIIRMENTIIINKERTKIISPPRMVATVGVLRPLEHQKSSIY